MPSTPTPSVLVTGATSGLGFETSRALARQGWRVVMASRDLGRARSAAAAVDAEVGGGTAVGLALGLASQADVRRAAADLVNASTPLDAVVCNAGVSLSGPLRTTDDGVEMTFGVNHLGHFLLTALLVGHLRRPARVVFVSSGTHIPDHRLARRTGTPVPVYTTARELAFPPDPSGGLSTQMLRYTTSKLCNVLCANELARRVEDRGLSTAGAPIDVFSVDPGLMAGTGLMREAPPVVQTLGGWLISALRPFVDGIRTPEQSGRDVARLVTDHALAGRSGAYFDGARETRASPVAYDRGKATDLWETSAELVGLRRDESPVA